MTKKTDGQSPSKRRRLMPTMGSSGTVVAPSQIPSRAAGSLAGDDGTPANPITLGDSSDDSNGGANISKVINNNNEKLSFSY